MATEGRKAMAGIDGVCVDIYLETNRVRISERRRVDCHVKGWVGWAGRMLEKYTR